MRMSPRSGGALTIVVLAALIAAGGVAPATAAPDFPSWEDVQNARANQAATEAKVTEIEGILAQLETEAEALGKVALEKGEEYAIASDNLDAATARADTLNAQADAAATSAKTSKAHAGQVVAQLARSGGGDLTVGLLFSSDADGLLDQLGTMNRLTVQSTRIYEQALADEKLAKSLTDQARVAQDERAKLEKTAADALAAAQAASKAAADRVESQKAATEQLYAQLAVLKGTTAAVEQGYLDGLAWERRQAAIRNPPPPAPPVNPTPPAPNGSAVAGAIAFAEAQIGDAYVLGGYGPDVWDCSGLTKGAYASVGVYIGTHSATNQYNTMAAVGRLVPLSEMVAGDLLWYSNGGSTSATKYHVTMYIGDGQMIEAPYPGATVRIRAVRYGDLVPYAGRPTP